MPCAAAGAELVHAAFDAEQRRVREIVRRVKERFERRDWTGIRQDTVARLDLHPAHVEKALGDLSARFGDGLADPALWAAMKEAYAGAIVGRDDVELAQTFFNSLTRKMFPEIGLDPGVAFATGELPVPYRGWEMASARMYGVHRIDAAVVAKVLADAGFDAPFRDLAADARLAAERLERGLVERFGSAEIEALDVLRPVFFRNKGAYVIGRARRGDEVMPVALALVNRDLGLEVDAVLSTEDELSIVWSFARWYFHADVASPRQVIGFLSSVLPRKRLAELYDSLGYAKHGKTEFYRDLVAQIAGSDGCFVRARGQRGLVMVVFTLPSYEFVFKVIKDSFPPQKDLTREKVMERYRDVLVKDRVGRLVGFQEFEHLSFPRQRFSAELLDKLQRVAAKTVEIGEREVLVRHAYVERRVTPLDVYLQEVDGARAEAAVIDWGHALKDLAAANIFPGDVLLKNFGVTRHGRVVSYDYDEIAALSDCTFRRLPPPRDEHEELAAEPWYTVGERDIFPEELLTFLGLTGRLREAFLAHHAELFEPEFWQQTQERIRRGEILDFYPYAEHRRLRPAAAAVQVAA